MTWNLTEYDIARLLAAWLDNPRRIPSVLRDVGALNLGDGTLTDYGCDLLARAKKAGVL